MFEIGNSLREARMRRMLELADAEHDTKIRLRYLAALESEDFALLPGSVYARGFLRTYARYLGLDAQTYIDEYNSRFGQFEELEESHAFHAPIAPLGQQTRRPRMLRVFLVVSLIALALLIFEGLRIHHGHKASEHRLNRAIASAPAQHSSVAGTRNPALPAPTDTTKTQRSVATSTPTTAKLTVQTGTGATWIEVQRESESGPIMYTGTIAAGAHKSFSAPQLYVTLGFPSAAKLSVGKHTVQPTQSSRESFVVTGTGIRAAQP